MTESLLHSKLRGLALLLAILLTAGFLKSAIAQDVVGVSEILSFTSSSEIDTYSATELSYAASLYYGAYVEGYLFDNGNQIGAGSAHAQQNAYGYMSKPLTVGDVYTIESDHYLIASYAYSSGGNYYYNNPDYFNPGDGSQGPSGSSFYPGGGPAYVETQYLYLGTTAVQVSSAKPSVNSISPKAGTIGKSGIINVNGQNLLDPFTGKASPAITGSGVTLSAATSSTDTQVNVNFSIDQGATTGDRSLTLQNRFGTSNAVAFTVGYPPAVVTNVSPSSWTAGQSTSVTITGTGFGTAPTLSATGTGVTLTLNSASPDGTTIRATAILRQNAPRQSITVQVQPGYAGSGFYCNCPPDQANGTDTVTGIPVTPNPQIMFNGQNISGQTNVPVLAGQKITLSVSAPSGYSLLSPSWTFGNAQHLVGGFTNSSLGGSSPPDTGGGWVQPANLTGNSVTNYFIVPGATESLTYTYNLDNGESATATASFQVNGPTATGANGTFFTAVPGAVNVWPEGEAFGGGSSAPGLEFGDVTPNHGMTFTTASNPPANQGMF